MRIPTGPPVTETLPPPPSGPPEVAPTMPHPSPIVPERRGFRQLITDPNTFSPSALKARWDEHRINKAQRDQEAALMGTPAHTERRQRTIVGVVIGGVALALFAYLETKNGGNRFDAFDTSLYLPDLSPLPADRPSLVTMDDWWQVGQRPWEEPNLVERFWHMDKYGIWPWDSPDFDGSHGEVDPRTSPRPAPPDPIPGPSTTPSQGPEAPGPSTAPNTTQSTTPDIPSTPPDTSPSQTEWTARRGDTLWEQSEQLLNDAGISDATITPKMRWDIIDAIDQGNASITDPDMIYADKTYDMSEGMRAAERYQRFMSDLIHHLEEDAKAGVS